MVNLFEAANMGGISVKNHFVRASTSERGATEDGHLTEELLDTYNRLAEGGVGTILTSYTHICKEEQSVPKQMGIYDDSFIDEYRKAVDIIHKHGTKVVMQIVYGGSFTQADPENEKVLGPSAIENPNSGITPKEMTKEDIQYVIKAFADAARRVKAAGFDGVQIHVAHGYLLSQFISPLLNHRTDEYGGSAQNRFRMVKDVYEAVRQEVGQTYPVWIKINSSDEKEGGLTSEDSLQMSRWLSELGADLIEVSGNSWRSRPADAPEGPYYKDYAVELAKDSKATVLLTGGNRRLEDMQEIADTSNVQFFGFARPLMKNPDFIKTLK